jgi:hypothetical protein
VEFIRSTPLMDDSLSSMRDHLALDHRGGGVGHGDEDDGASAPNSSVPSRKSDARLQAIIDTTVMIGRLIAKSEMYRADEEEASDRPRYDTA